MVGFVQWRAAFYVAGEDGAVANFMHLLDDFFVFKAKQAQKEVEIHIYQPGSSEITRELLQDDCAYEHYCLHADEDAPPLKYFDAQPVYGKKVLPVACD